MACENCIALSAFKAEFSEVKTDIKLIIRLISMLLVDRGSEIGEVAQSVQYNQPDPNLNQPDLGSSVLNEASAYSELEPEALCNFDPANTSDDRSEVGVDAAAMINVKVEETSEFETTNDAYENGLACSFTNQYNRVVAYSPADIATSSTDTSDVDVPWCMASGSGDHSYGGDCPQRSRGMNVSGEMVRVGGDPNVLLPVEHFTDIVNRSNSAAKLLQGLVTASIPDYANYTFEIVKASAACPKTRSRDGLKSLRQHPAFAACVNETSKQFGVFEFDTKLQYCLYKKCFDSRQTKKFKAQAAAASVGDVPTAAGAELFQPSANDDCGSSNDTHERNVLTTRSVFIVPHHAAIMRHAVTD